MWITGASTGIGREVALQLAAAGVTVAASARSADKLKAIAPSVHAFPLDVTDRDAVIATVAKIEATLSPIDLALFAAGTYTPLDPSHIDPAEFAHTMSVNYLGVVNCLAAMLPPMRKRRSGRIAWIASVAGYRGLPKAGSYGPSKAALINLAESLKPELELSGVALSVVNPGFVETPMTDRNDFKMPFLMQPADAARLTIKGLADGRFEVAYPWRFVFILKLARVLPYSLFFWLIRKGVLKS